MPPPPLQMRAGLAGALAPLALFLTGVAWLALSGAPDERGFWPVLLAALTLGLLLARDRQRYAEAPNNRHLPESYLRAGQHRRCHTTRPDQHKEIGANCLANQRGR